MRSTNSAEVKANIAIVLERGPKNLESLTKALSVTDDFSTDEIQRGLDYLLKIGWIYQRSDGKYEFPNP